MDSSKRTPPKSPPGQKDGRYQRLVIKLGTNLLTGGTGSLDIPTMSGLVDQVAQLHREGREIVLVSSGAIAAGRDKLAADRDRRDIPFRQILAAVGQGRLMRTYEDLFDRHGIVVAQALLTKRELSHRAGYLNARNTIMSLLSLRVVPIINENDVVATDEIKEEKFGDNDNLSAMVANLLDADLLILLSDVPGLYTADPRKNPDAQLIPVVEKIDASIESMAGGAGTSRGTGGMATKIEAAKLATRSGIAVVITEGSIPNVITRLAEGESIGTLFLPTATRVESRQRWMISRLASRGKIVIDDGAAAALRKRKGSLLPAGIRDTEKEFRRGDMVDIVDQQGNRVACGMSNYSAAEIQIIKGAQSRQIMSLLGYEYGAEVVHRNNLVVL
ncbi:MAG: glutamate 5-kinase [Dehalococcoidia bacterium]|nr:glutamate 5-kinase [Dehalococcoidia bacterium]